MKPASVLLIAFTTATATAIALSAPPQATLWEGNTIAARLIVPTLDGPMKDIVTRTINGRLSEWSGRSLPLARQADGPGLHILVGDDSNNPAIAELTRDGLRIDRNGLGDEGFRLLSTEKGNRRFLIVSANSPRGLKHGCQELLFYHLSLTAQGASVDWPLDVQMKPAAGYRGIYMLPCWSAHDSIENWRRVIEFNSELTLNRVWFWLGGFPLMEKYGGEYQGTDLARVENVRGLVALCREEGMKFHVGDGWFTWHHARAARGDLERGIQYYVDLVNLLPGCEGIYLEPIGEGKDSDEATWRKSAAGIRTLAESVWKEHPDLEFAIAIGKFNSPEYRRLIHEIDSRRIFWWWCWGDPLVSHALSEHPLVLRWHTSVHMSEYHGSPSAPRPEEMVLTGFATSYDPGQGYGNPWNGWAKLGVDQRRDVHPYTMPYFSHQYLFRERCWDPAITPERLAVRLSRRLFDGDMPAEAIDHYMRLASMCPRARQADPQELDAIDAFITAHAQRGSARNRDTLGRMKEAVNGIRQEKAKPEKKADKKN